MFFLLEKYTFVSSLLLQSLHGHPLAARETESVNMCLFQIKVINKNEGGECVGKALTWRLELFISRIIISAVPLVDSANVDKAHFLFGFSCIISEVMRLEKMMSEGINVLGLVHTDSWEWSVSSQSVSSDVMVWIWPWGDGDIYTTKIGQCYESRLSIHLFPSRWLNIYH